MKQIVLGGVAPKRKPAPRAPKRKRRRTGRQALNYLLLLIVAAAVMVALSVTVLFNIKTVITEGLTKYAPQAVIEASGVKEGDNLLRVNERAVRKRLLELFPYIEDVSLRRVLPDKLAIEVTEAAVLGACQTDSGYVIVGGTGRILETGVSQPPSDAMTVYGMYIHDAAVNRILGTGFDKEEQEAKEQELASLESLSHLVEAVRETGFSDITLVDFSDPLNMAVVYDGRVLIELGSIADLRYKLQFVSYVLEEQLQEGYQGKVDASYCSTSNSVVTSPGDISQELELRRLRAGGASAQEAMGADQPAQDAKENPELVVKPKEESSSSSTSSSGPETSSSGDSAGDGSSDSESQASSMIGPYTPDELAVKPPPAGASRAAENSEGEESSGGES